MRSIANRLKYLTILALLAVGFGLTGCKSSGDQTLAQQWGDRQVAQGVKRQLNKDQMFKYPDVVPVVNDGVVQLTGFVDTPAQRQRAAQLAVRAKGVREVINVIDLKPARVIESPAPPSPNAAPPLAEAAGPTDQQPKSEP